MKEQILRNLDHPEQLEQLYRENKRVFEQEFNALYPEIRDHLTARIWNQRLNFEHEEISWGTGPEWIFVILASALAGCIAKIPDLATLSPDSFYPRNLPFILLPFLAAFFAWKRQLALKPSLAALLLFVASAVYINVLPLQDDSDTLLLACIHLPLFLWTVLGFTYVGGQMGSPEKRLDFLRYNGDLLVMTAIMALAGGLLMGISISLFALIDVHLEEFYAHYVVIWGAPAAVIMGTLLVQSNPQLVGKVSPVIAKVFTPLVLLTLLAFLAAVLFAGKDPYRDREFLLLFNIVLIGVMALILFSLAGTSHARDNRLNSYLLLALSGAAALANGIALSAILFRISEWGFTPNRLAVLGSNLLILSNLLAVIYRLYRNVRYRESMERVEQAMTSFLPLYSAWTALVTFLFPLLFQFR